MNSLKKISAITAIVFLALIPSYSALADIPYLKWERGQVQQVVLGGVAAENNWQIQLQGNGIEPLDFKVSEKAQGGYVVYSLFIPVDTPRGPYLVAAIKPGGSIKIVASILLLGTDVYKVTAVPRDLSFIVSILVFMTAVASTIRAQKYSRMSFRSTQPIPKQSPHFQQKKPKEPILWRIRNIAYTTRIKAISGFETSLFKFLLIREGELIHRANKQVYAYLPILGAIGGFIAANETEKAGGIAKASLAVFIAMAIISIADAYSGVLATLGFWFAQLAFGNISSFRDILLMFAVGIGWIGPIFAFAIFQSTVSRDFSRTNPEGPTPIGSLAVLVAGPVFGASIFYFGHKLINSVLIEINAQREVSLLALGIIAGALLVRGLADGLIENKKAENSEETAVQLESITIARVSSPQTFFGMAAGIFGFTFLWTKDAQTSAIVAALFSAPYALLLIRFNKLTIPGLGRIPRNVLLESAVVTAIAVYLFRDISSKPMLIDVMSQKFLILAGCPAIAHAIYSLVCDSSNRAERIKA
jgi:hypothetical protein